MTTLLLPNSELVAIAWLKGVPGIPAAQIGATLPAVEAWVDTGFVQVGVVGGTPNLDLPVARPVIGVKCWAANRNGARPPWGKAAQLAELIRAGCYGRVDDASPASRVVDMPVAGYGRAHVSAVYWVTEPRRIPQADAARYAMFSGDLQIHWWAAP